MKIPDFLETYIVRFAISKSGPLLTKAITALVATAVAFLAQKLPGIEFYLNEYVLTGIIWVFLDYLYGLIPVNIEKKYGREIQKALNDKGAELKVDGFIGPKTVKAAIKIDK